MTATTTELPVLTPLRKESSLKKRPRRNEVAIRGALFVCAAISIGTTLAILYTLLSEAVHFFTAPGVTLAEFFFTTTWAPEFEAYGILPLVTATFITSVIAVTVALPVGLAAAIYLSEYASPRARGLLKPILELLVGVPTVVFGYFALTFVTPLIRQIFGEENVQFYNMASAGLVLGFAVLPIIASMSEDALNAVPRALREASLGLGATKLETSLKIVVPAALSGIAAAVIVGVSRAMGETMIVLLAAGAGPNFTFNPFQSAETMTGHIARISTGDLSYESMDYISLFAIGLMLFLMTLGLNLISRWFVRRFREVY